MFNTTHKLITKTINLFVVIFTLMLSTYVSAASDPTKPLFGAATPAVTAKVKSALVLQSVIKSGQSYKAVINGKLLNQGEMVLAYKIIDIQATSVVLVSPEKRLVLSLFSDSKFVKVVNK